MRNSKNAVNRFSMSRSDTQTSTTMLAARRICLALAALVCFVATGRAAIAADTEPVKLIPVADEAIKARVKTLGESAPEKMTLAAYLDCGSQAESAGSGVKIRWMPEKVYLFPSEVKNVPACQATVAYGASQVEFELSGLDPAKHYIAGLSWWDFDDGGRTQSVLVLSPDGRRAAFGVSAVRLPNYKSDGLLPAEKRFALPPSFVQDGKVNLVVQLASGANAVISELWVWETR